MQQTLYPFNGYYGTCDLLHNGHSVDLFVYHNNVHILNFDANTQEMSAGRARLVVNDLPERRLDEGENIYEYFKTSENLKPLEFEGFQMYEYTFVTNLKVHKIVTELRGLDPTSIDHKTMSALTPRLKELGYVRDKSDLCMINALCDD